MLVSSRVFQCKVFGVWKSFIIDLRWKNQECMTIHIQCIQDSPPSNARLLEILEAHISDGWTIEQTSDDACKRFEQDMCQKPFCTIEMWTQPITFNM